MTEMAKLNLSLLECEFKHKGGLLEFGKDSFYYYNVSSIRPSRWYKGNVVTAKARKFLEVVSVCLSNKVVPWGLSMSGD